MAYFDCFVVGAWMFAIGWFLGAVYIHNRNEKAESPRVTEIFDETEILETYTEDEASRVPAAASAGAD